MAINIAIRDELPEDAVVFDNASYDNSIIGTTFDGKAIYAYDLMVRELMNDDNITEEEAIDWIDFNTLRSLPYGGPKAPLVVYRDTY